MSVFSPKTDETPLSTAATTQSLPQKKLRAVSFREIKSLKEQEAYSISLLGSSGVGKTSLIHKAKTNDFQNNCSPSTGIACTSFYFQNTNDDTIIRLDVNDICGNVLYNTFNDKTLSRTNLVVLVYAVDDKKSFEDLDNWLEQYKKNATAQNCLVYLVANKTDIEEVEVKKAEGKKYYDNNNFIKFVETSAKNKPSIDLFKDIAEYLSGKIKKWRKTIKLIGDTAKKIKKRKCC